MKYHAKKRERKKDKKGTTDTHTKSMDGSQKHHGKDKNLEPKTTFYMILYV